MNEINEDLKKSSKCEMERFKSKFRRNTNTSDRFHPQCKFCRKKCYNENFVKNKNYYLENRDRKKEYYLENLEKVQTNILNILKTDFNYLN